MTQRRLNAIVVCHTHQKVLDSLSVTGFAKLLITQIFDVGLMCLVPGTSTVKLGINYDLNL